MIIKCLYLIPVWSVIGWWQLWYPYSTVNFVAVYAVMYRKSFIWLLAPLSTLSTV